MSKETELSDEQIEEVFQSHANDDPEMHLRFARVIKAAHGIAAQQGDKT